MALDVERFKEFFPAYKLKGSLKARMINCFTHGYSEPIVIFVLQQLLAALDYLHKHYFVHRGIKCCNILTSGGNGQIIVAGFGNAACLIDNGVIRKSLHDYNKHMKHCINWLAPEVLDQGNLGYTTKSDMYMLGATVVEMCNGLEPFFGFQPYKIMLEKRRDKKLVLIDKNTADCATDASYPLKKNDILPSELTRREFSRDLHKFAAFCLNFNPDDRLSANELCQKFHKMFDHNKLRDDEFNQLFKCLPLIDENFKIDDSFLDLVEEEPTLTLDWEF